MRAPAIAPVLLPRRHAVIVGTRLARGMPCIELITKAVPGLPLLISALERGRGMTSAGTGDLYTPTRKVQEAIRGRETDVLEALGPPGVIAAFGARHWRCRPEVVE